MSRGAGFFSAGIADVEARVSRVLPPPISDDPRVIRTIESGVIGEALTRLQELCRIAFTASLTASLLRRVSSAWYDAHWSARRRGAGVVLIVAAIVHIALSLSAPAEGWLWMVIPMLAAVTGLLAIAASVGPGAREAR